MMNEPNASGPTVRRASRTRENRPSVLLVSSSYSSSAISGRGPAISRSSSATRSSSDSASQSTPTTRRTAARAPRYLSRCSRMSSRARWKPNSRACASSGATACGRRTARRGLPETAWINSKSATNSAAVGYAPSVGPAQCVCARRRRSQMNSHLRRYGSVALRPAASAATSGSAAVSSSSDRSSASETAT